MNARYRLLEHEDFTEALSREDLFVLAERGSIGRGDICEDIESGRSHVVGELIQGLRVARSADGAARVERPAYMEIRADGVRVEALGDADDREQDGDDDADPAEDDEGYDLTASRERILYHGHPSWLCYSKALFLVLLLAVAGALAVPLGPRYALLGFLCSSATLICVGIGRSSRDYLITEERVEVIWGLIGRSSKELRIRDIRAIDVRERWFTGLLGLGSVDFSSSANSGVEVVFDYIRKAHAVKELVRRLQRELDAGDRD